MDNNQFYPTPPALAKRLWALFKNKEFSRVLEPSAGRGDLIKAMPGYAEKERYRYRSEIPVDVVEIDMNRHSALRELGVQVVGLDFLEHSSGSIYSHVILNPPFNAGATHCLKAWDLLWSGEVAAILAAETILNPFSAERKRLVKLIEAHGSVEFVSEAFMDPDTQRKTAVEVALVWLEKTAPLDSLLGDLIGEMRDDGTSVESLGREWKQERELALPNSTIQNAVTMFNAAVRSMKESVHARAKANYYARLIGDTMAVLSGETGRGLPKGDTEAYVRNTTLAEYVELKDRAWANVLRSSQVTTRLSSAAAKQIEAGFEEIKRLEFTVKNIHAFLLGIVESQGAIQKTMVLDCFDKITQFHSDNTVLFRQYKSNLRHRTCGYRIKTTRFILPGFQNSGYSREKRIDHGAMQRLRDFDRVFALLDGRYDPEKGYAPEYGLVDAFTNDASDLADGCRISTSYFDVRWYPGIGTVHFFPKSKSLMDAMNRYVGRERQWIPAEPHEASADFWKNYDLAESFDKEIRAEINKTLSGRTYWGGPIEQMMRGRDEEEASRAAQTIDKAMEAVQVRRGLDIDNLLDHAPAQLRLAA